MDIRKINEKVSVAGQLNANDMAEAARLGFRTVVNNRPDGEGGSGQPPSADVEAAARAAGMDFIYMPVVSGQISEDNIADFQKVLAQAKTPVLAYCRTGTRCCNLWALAEAPNAAASDIVSMAAGAGYDLRGIAPVLQARGKQ